MSKILIIEDDALISRMYKQAFSFEGFKVTVANNGVEGITQAKEIIPDIIFCDIMMPKMNGLEVLKNLKLESTTKDIPIIMLTNMSGTQDSKKAIDNGAYAYLVKSEFKPKEIVQKAKEFLSSFKKTDGASPTPIVEEKQVEKKETPKVEPVAKEKPVEKKLVEKEETPKEEPAVKEAPVEKKAESPKVEPVAEKKPVEKKELVEKAENKTIIKETITI